MASSSFLFVVVVASCLLVGISVKSVDGKTVASREFRQTVNCSETRGYSCFDELQTLDDIGIESLHEKIIASGLDYICRLSKDARRCAVDFLDACSSDNFLDEDLNWTLITYVEQNTFLCKTAFDDFNAERGCIFSQDFDKFTLEKCRYGYEGCQTHLKGQLCLAKAIEDVCSNSQLANRYRDFVGRLQSSLNCDGFNELKRS